MQPHHTLLHPAFLQRIHRFAAKKFKHPVIFNSVSSSWSETIQHHHSAYYCWEPLCLAKSNTRNGKKMLLRKDAPVHLLLRVLRLGNHHFWMVQAIVQLCTQNSIIAQKLLFEEQDSLLAICQRASDDNDATLLKVFFELVRARGEEHVFSKLMAQITVVPVEGIEQHYMLKSYKSYKVNTLMVVFRNSPSNEIINFLIDAVTPEQAKLLLETEDSDERTPLDILCRTGSPEHIDCLLQKIEQIGGTGFLKSQLDGDADLTHNNTPEAFVKSPLFTAFTHPPRTGNFKVLIESIQRNFGTEYLRDVLNVANRYATLLSYGCNNHCSEGFNFILDTVMSIDDETFVKYQLTDNDNFNTCLGALLEHGCYAERVRTFCSAMKKVGILAEEISSYSKEGQLELYHLGVAAHFPKINRSRSSDRHEKALWKKWDDKKAAWTWNTASNFKLKEKEDELMKGKDRKTVCEKQGDTKINTKTASGTSTGEKADEPKEKDKVASRKPTDHGVACTSPPKLRRHNSVFALRQKSLNTKSTLKPQTPTGSKPANSSPPAIQQLAISGTAIKREPFGSTLGQQLRK